MNAVAFPAMRAEVLRAVQALADPEYQRRVWVDRTYPHESFYDDLDMNIHILFDDAAVLPKPEDRVGSVIYEREVPALAALGRVLDALIDDLGDASDEKYLADARWADVVAVAAQADAVMGRSGSLDVAD